MIHDGMSVSAYCPQLRCPIERSLPNFFSTRDYVGECSLCSSLSAHVLCSGVFHPGGCGSAGAQGGSVGHLPAPGRGGLDARRPQLHHQLQVSTHSSVTQISHNHADIAGKLLVKRTRHLMSTANTTSFRPGLTFRLPRMSLVVLSSLPMRGLGPGRPTLSCLTLMKGFACLSSESSDYVSSLVLGSLQQKRVSF